jgi:hypothetical protein
MYDLRLSSCPSSGVSGYVVLRSTKQYSELRCKTLNISGTIGNQ